MYPVHTVIIIDMSRIHILRTQPKNNFLCGDIACITSHLLLFHVSNAVLEISNLMSQHLGGIGVKGWSSNGRGPVAAPFWHMGNQRSASEMDILHPPSIVEATTKISRSWGTSNGTTTSASKPGRVISIWPVADIRKLQEEGAKSCFSSSSALSSMGFPLKSSIAYGFVWK